MAWSLGLGADMTKINCSRQADSKTLYSAFCISCVVVLPIDSHIMSSTKRLNNCDCLIVSAMGNSMK